MAVLVDVRTDGPATASAASLSWSHTVAAGLSNSILLVTGTIYTGSATTITSLVWDALGAPVALTRKGQQIDGSAFIYAEIWYLLSPAAGTAVIKATYNISTAQALHGSASYYNVDQTTPFNAASPQSSSGVGPTQPSLNVSSDVGGMVVDSLCDDAANTHVDTPVPNGSQTQIDYGSAGAGNLYGSASDLAASSTSTAMGWTGIASGFGWGQVGVALTPAIISYPALPTSSGALGGHNLGAVVLAGGVSQGTTVPQSVSGSISLAGGLNLQVRHAVAGSVGSAGSFSRKDLKVLLASLTPIGSVLKVGQKVFTGSDTPAGALLISRLSKLNEAGSVTPAGTLLKQKATSIVGSTTSSGTILRTTGKGISGGLTPAGNIQRRTSKVAAGTLGPAGIVALSRLVKLGVTGSVTSSGTLRLLVARAFSAAGQLAGVVVKLAAKALTGGLTPAGTVSQLKVKQVAVTGSNTPTGNILKRAAHGLVGSVTLGGTLVKNVGRLITGGVGSVGGLLRRVPQAVVGSLTPTGTLTTIKVKLLNLIGVLTPGGVLVKRVFKAFTASQATAGGLVKVPAKKPIGTVTTGGTLLASRLATKVLAGAVVSAGSLTRRALKSLLGTLIPQGALVKQLREVLAGLVTTSAILEQGARLVPLDLSGSLTPAGTLLKVARHYRTFTGSLFPLATLTDSAITIVTLYFSAFILPALLIEAELRRALALQAELQATLTADPVAARTVAVVTDLEKGP